MSGSSTADARPAARPPRRGHHVARGMTFLEVVFASALLAIVAAAVFSAIGFMRARQEHELHRLASAELCNRLVLMYLDDESSLPPTSRPLEYNGQRYRWAWREQPLSLLLAAEDGGAAPAAGEVMLDALKQVEFRVWLSEESGGAPQPGAGVPGAYVSRMVNPVAIRNPDSSENMINSDEGRRRFIEQFRTRPGTRPRPSTPGSGTPKAEPIPGNGSGRGAP